MRPSISIRSVLVGASVTCMLIAACSNGETTNAAPRIDCTQPPGPPINYADPEFDEGPCLLQRAPNPDESWELVAGWKRVPSEGSSGDGPCIDIKIVTPDGTGSGAGWCDLPEARIIGEFHSREVGPDTNAAWGPVVAGRVDRVRVEFAGTVPYIVRTKPTPWPGFDYWFVTFEKTRQPTAMVALDENDGELARETIPP